MHQIFFGSFLRHIGTFLDYLGGDDTPVGSVPAAQNLGQVEQIHLAEWGGQYLGLY